MNPSDLRLQRKLLAWLLSPLLALLVLDAGVTWWSSRHLSNLAYDRSLQEIAREIVLDVNPGAGGPQLELTQAAERILRSERAQHSAASVRFHEWWTPERAGALHRSFQELLPESSVPA